MCARYIYHAFTFIWRNVWVMPTAKGTRSHVSLIFQQCANVCVGRCRDMCSPFTLCVHIYVGISVVGVRDQYRCASGMFTQYVHIFVGRTVIVYIYIYIFLCERVYEYIFVCYNTYREFCTWVLLSIIYWWT